VTFLEGCFGFCKIKIPLRIQKLGRLLLPDADHLRGFFFEGHAREQIFDTNSGGE